MKSKTILFDGNKGMELKGVDIWGDNLAGWTILSGDGAETTSGDYYKLIPTLYRAVQIISYYVSTMPFVLKKGKTEYDKSAEWKNKIGFMSNPFTLLQLIVSSLEIAGNCYLFRERNQVVTRALYYCLASSIKVELDEEKHKVEYFERAVKVNGMTIPKKFAPEEFVYFWLPDPYVEFGPANNYPVLAAANACGVLLNMDVFAANFFEHGAIKVTLLTVEGAPTEAEKKKLSDWWKRIVSGVKNAFSSNVISATVKPVVIGEGMKELENVTIGEEKREDIAIAMGIPMSILFANAANYATSQQDELNFLTQTIIPLCQFIESILNEQIFEALGLHWQFLPETLDAMQEDEASRAVALGQLTGAGLPLLMAMEILGYELTDEQMAELKAAEEEKKRKAEELAQRLAQKPEPQPGQDEQVQDEKPADNTNSDTTFKSELEKWRRKAINAMKKGKPANVDFVTTVIPSEICQTIATALEMALSETDVKDAFDVTATTEPKFGGDSIMTLAAELKRANDILERTE
jgi:HK97 family phage portal protein